MESPDQTNMVVHEEVATSSNGNPITDKNTGIAKGKRTKRQRPQSPISFCLNHNDNNNYNTLESQGSRSDICINISANTETLSSDDFHAYKTKEEEDEEDIANCLILLAQGQPRYLCRNSSYNDDYYKQPAEQKKFTSKKFLETPYGDKAGYYVYECKTCFKTFPSFQALGGHRASHVKPKKEDNNVTLLVDEGKTHYSPSKSNLNGYDDNHSHIYKSCNNKKPRIHECTACGAKFLSGQALGGHMRRHRTPGGARVNNVNGGSRHDHDDNYFPQLPSSLLLYTLPFMTTMNSTMDHNGRPPSSVDAQNLCLNLDLNLAAPVEDESSKIHSTTKEDSTSKTNHPRR